MFKQGKTLVSLMLVRNTSCISTAAHQPSIIASQVRLTVCYIILDQDLLCQSKTEKSTSNIKKFMLGTKDHCESHLMPECRCNVFIVEQKPYGLSAHLYICHPSKGRELTLS